MLSQVMFVSSVNNENSSNHDEDFVGAAIMVVLVLVKLWY